MELFTIKVLFLIFINPAGIQNEAIAILNAVISNGICIFYNCSTLKNIIIPNSVISIGYFVFRFCSELNTVAIGVGRAS